MTAFMARRLGAQGSVRFWELCVSEVWTWTREGYIWHLSCDTIAYAKPAR
jgi:hypothetical protein